MTDTPTTNIDLVRTLIRAVDDQNHNAIATLTSKDVHFRFGSADPTNTQSELLAAARSFRAAIADLHHTFVNVWEVDDGIVFATMDVNYRRLDDRELTLPTSKMNCGNRSPTPPWPTSRCCASTKWGWGERPHRQCRGHSRERGFRRSGRASVARF